MHELAVTEGILKVALEAAAQAGGPRIHAIDLVIGDLSGMVDDSIQFYFDILSRDTAATGATLRFRREPANVTCQECGAQYAAQPPLIAALFEVWRRQAPCRRRPRVARGKHRG